jgi:hypothetical protein
MILSGTILYTGPPIVVRVNFSGTVSTDGNNIGTDILPGTWNDVYESGTFIATKVQTAPTPTPSPAPVGGIVALPVSGSGSGSSALPIVLIAGGTALVMMTRRLVRQETLAGVVVIGVTSGARRLGTSPAILAAWPRARSAVALISVLTL